MSVRGKSAFSYGTMMEEAELCLSVRAFPEEMGRAGLTHKDNEV